MGSYKNSIILSALVMFIGMGTLVLARHPALHSLAEVVIVGMFSVVLMAYIFPPLLFKWLAGHGFLRKALAHRHEAAGNEAAPQAEDAGGGIPKETNHNGNRYEGKD